MKDFNDVEVPKLDKEKLFKKFKSRIRRNFNAVSQLVNCWLLFGFEDESMSSRFYRWSLKDGFLWKIPALIVDTILFWDYSIENGKKLKHCEKSYENEVKRSGVPFDLR